MDMSFLEERMEGKNWTVTETVLSRNVCKTTSKSMEEHMEWRFSVFFLKGENIPGLQSDGKDSLERGERQELCP